eukprot:g543.t1
MHGLRLRLQQQLVLVSTSTSHRMRSEVRGKSRIKGKLRSARLIATRASRSACNTKRQWCGARARCVMCAPTRVIGTVVRHPVSLGRAAASF